MNLSDVRARATGRALNAMTPENLLAMQKLITDAAVKARAILSRNGSIASLPPIISFFEAIICQYQGAVITAAGSEPIVPDNGSFGSDDPVQTNPLSGLKAVEVVELRWRESG